MRKTTKVALVLVPVLLLGVPLLTVGVTSTVNAVATVTEAERIVPYGQLVPVGEHRMNVVVQGDHDRTIVLLPGLGTGAPGRDFAPLIDELDDTFRVIAVEPLGTGLSDQTDVPRTAENITREVHEALQYLGVERYILAGHSISGIYALTYTAAYRDEVDAFVGIDSSVPDQPGSTEALPTDAVATMNALGITRVLQAIGPDPYAGADFDDSAKEQMRILTTRNAAASTMLDEMDRTAANFAEVSAQVFAPDLPVLLFVRADDPDGEDWVGLHERQAASVQNGEVVLVSGSHYLHHTAAAEISAETTRFVDSLGG